MKTLAPLKAAYIVPGLSSMGTSKVHVLSGKFEKRSAITVSLEFVRPTCVLKSLAHIHIVRQLRRI